jgi:predicted metalloprotease with PDZ domain
LLAVLLPAALWFSLSACFAADVSPAVRYEVSLAHPEQHLVHVRILLPPGPDDPEMQLPVWNALYQVRDFSQHINWIRARGSSGQLLAVRLVDKSRWRLAGAQGGAEIEYEIAADDPGPYGAQLNPQHAFFNLAEILMYAVDRRASPIQLRFTDVPAGWKIATPLSVTAGGELTAGSYDLLVDAPVEAGQFREADFDEGGAHYRVVVDADGADYNMEKIVPTVRRIVAAATDWMKDRPFDSYMFLYHFPREPSGGGMEHAYSTAIDVNARVLAEAPQSLADVTAHEFFHLWNVKRIRPQSLAPVDYTKENYTTMLWFCEGVTDTAQNQILLRAGLLDERGFLNRLAADIAELENRPAHLTQSAEEASLDAWLEKYQAYLLPERSISYYNKGDLLGMMLDLTMRDATHGAASLRDLLQWMNRNYAQQGRFFPDPDGVRLAAEAVSHADLRWFFEKYVAGTEEIPWDDFLKGVGLHLVRENRRTADIGFWATRNFGMPPTVGWVTSKSAAERAGLKADDSILEINGRATSSDFRQQLDAVQPNGTIRLKVRNARGEHELSWTVGVRESVEFSVQDLDNATPRQRARRKAWLSGEDQPEAQH